jgi:tRNA-specific 2-thiouridylase
LLLRPLCALRLPPTKPEREQWVDRTKFYNFSGTGRRKLIALARRFGITTIPPQTVGCALVEKSFAARVHQLVQLQDAPSAWDFELLKVGRHSLLSTSTKVVVGRNAAENAMLAQLHARGRTGSSLLLEPIDFRGPSALLVSPNVSAKDVRLAIDWVLRYTRDSRATAGHVRLQCGQRDEKIALGAISAPHDEQL